MSDKPISKGDLVMVVRGMPCCSAKTGAEGLLFIVTNLRPSTGACLSCRDRPVVMTAVGLRGSNEGVDLSRLIRIDPPALSEDVPTKEELTV